MKSVKPGRGPSFMAGIMAVALGLFGVVWTAATLFTGMPFMPWFGVIFIILSIASAIYHFKNATGENRYSTLDVVEGNEEPDPLNRRFCEQSAAKEAQLTAEEAPDGSYCPYCGRPAKPEYAFCKNCGKAL